MERKIFKNVILLSVVGLLALHMSVAKAQDSDPGTSGQDASDHCVLEQE